MRTKIFFIFLVVCSNLFAQQKEDQITIAFDNTPLTDALQQIENQTPYTFFYLETWLEGISVSGNYTNEPVSTLLDDLFTDTVLNYYLAENNRIILLQNNIVYDTLPKGFFGERDTIPSTNNDIDQSISAPVFYNETKKTTPQPIETIRIGKSSDTTSRSRFNFSGRVIHKETGKPIENAAITINNGRLGTVTDTNGAFTLSLPSGVYLFSASFLGFSIDTKRIILYNDGRYDFQLEENLQNLDEVMLIGNVNKNIEATDMGTTEVDVEQIKNIPLVLGERDVFKAAATLPGIASAGEGASGYNVRGGKTDQNLILLDDGVIYNPVHFFGIFSAVNPFTSDELTVYKGHIPAKFGGRLSSVFDIKTKEAETQKFSGEASIGPVTSNLVLETPIIKEKAGILVGGRTTFSNIILRNLDEEELRKSEASFYDVMVKYDHELNENNTISVTGYYSGDSFSITSDSLLSYNNRMINMQWDKKINDAVDLNVFVGNSDYSFDLGFNGQSNTNFDLTYQLNETNFKTNFNHRVGEKHRLGYGLAAKLYRNDPGTITPRGDNSIVTPITINRERALESAVYFSDIIKISERLTAEAGIRLSFFAALGENSQNIYQEGVPRQEGTLLETRTFGANEVIETYLTPEYRTSLRYLLSSTFSVKGSVNRQAQYLHQLTTNTTASPVDIWKLSDINIQPQRGTQYALGFFKNFEEGMYETSIEGYYKDSDNVLDYKVGAETLLNEALEQEVLQGRGRSYGVELLLRKNRGKLNGWVGYTYSRSLIQLDSPFAEERVNGGDFFPSNFDKPHDFSTVLNYKITKRFSFSGNFVYQTGRPVTVPIGNFVVNNTEFVLFSDRNEFRIPDYYRLDLSFNVEGNHRKNKLAHSFWNISVYNVLGRNNPYSVFFVAEDGDVKAFQTSIFSVPIPTISYNLKF